MIFNLCFHTGNPTVMSHLQQVDNNVKHFEQTNVDASVHTNFIYI